VVSLQQRWEYACDECSRKVPVPDEDSGLSPHEGDPLMPDGWVHTMMGADLCQWCQS
jgi:hypothetical protein